MFNMDKLKEIRLSRNMTQGEIADILQVTRSSYAMWESNNNIIPLKRLIQLCDYFNCSLDYAMGLVSRNSFLHGKYDLSLCCQRLREFRKENKLTQEKLARFLHIDQPTWSIYENGKSLIGTPFLYMICKKYHISADYLLGRVDNPKYLK